MKKIKEYYQEIKNSIQGKKFFGIDAPELLLKSLLGIVLVLTIVSIMPSERPFEYENLTVGSIAQEEIIAPFTFPIIKSESELKKERREAWLSVPPVFVQKAESEHIQSIKLRNLLGELGQYFKVLSQNRTKASHSDSAQANIFLGDSLLEEISLKYHSNLTADDLNILFQIFKRGDYQKFVNQIITGFEKVYQEGIIDIPKNRMEETVITLINDGLEEQITKENILDLEGARDLLRDYYAVQFEEQEEMSRIAFKISDSFLSADYIFEESITQNRKDKAVREVPSTSGFVHKNQRIIDNHEIVTEEVRQKLLSMATALAERSGSQSGWHQLLFQLGKYVFAIILTLMVGFFLYFYRRQVYSNNLMLLMITTVFVFQFLTAMLVQNVLEWSYLAIPITLGPMLLSMLMDATIAFMGTIIISLVLGAAGGNNFYLALMTFVVGTVALFSVQKIRNRGQMFRAILYIMMGYLTINLSYGFLHYEPFNKMVQNFAYYQLPNAILVPTAVFLLIGIFERFFDVTTDITLLELSDLNHPLLKRLSVEAPGTFHHSIIVGNLAEAAAKEIGANSLLARVGCYYHDIGKMQLSEYFVENQTDSTSKHDALTPSMSSLILSKHVRAGLLLADEYGLPLAVKKFIPEHHGTSVMSYFYHKAQENVDSKELNENDYRYPGPKPQSKETAIAMLSDTVEAASRTLPNPNLQRISALVDNLIEKRFQEGELDECDITLRELNKIKSAFTRILMGVHHLRIEYPNEDKQKDKSSKSSPDKELSQKQTEPESHKNEQPVNEEEPLNTIPAEEHHRTENIKDNPSHSPESHEKNET